MLLSSIIIAISFTSYPEYLVPNKTLEVKYSNTNQQGQGIGSLDLVVADTPGSLAILSNVPLDNGDLKFTVPESLVGKKVKLTLMKSTNETQPKQTVIETGELEVKSDGDPKQMSSDSTGNNSGTQNKESGANWTKYGCEFLLSILFLY
eukprot:NODE_432_length_7521_cov_0.745891.p8 type:complete len:149 gc:universal NODE_432_length_7521_cov_0.745891:7211-6765(-)